MTSPKGLREKGSDRPDEVDDLLSVEDGKPSDKYFFGNGFIISGESSPSPSRLNAFPTIPLLIHRSMRHTSTTNKQTLRHPPTLPLSLPQ